MYARALALVALLALAACGAAPTAAPAPPGDGLYVVYVGGLEGYADAEGKVVIAPAFSLAHVFTEGLGLVFTPDQERAGFIDPTGAWVIPPAFAFAKPFSDGRAAAKDPATGDWGYIDRQGAWVIPAVYERAMPFRDGRATVIRGRAGAVIDPSGAVVFALPAEAELGDPPRFSEGLMAIELPGGVRVVDVAGATVFEGPWRFARECHEGLMAVRGEDGWSYVDRSGRVVLSGHDFAWGFREGLAPVKPRGEARYGFIDRTGEVVIPPRFDDVLAFSEGLAAATVDGRVGYIDRSGRWVVEPKWVSPQSSGEMFRGGRAMVGQKDDEGRLLRGYIDRAGRVVFAPSR